MSKMDMFWHTLGFMTGAWFLGMGMWLCWFLVHDIKLPAKITITIEKRTK